MKREISTEMRLDMYYDMLRDREFETKAGEYFFKGVVQGFVHVGLGEEAVPAGICRYLRDTDYLTTYHRGHGHMLLKGADAKQMMAELCGRETGYCKGKGGSQHIAVPELGIIGNNGIVGAGQAIATGAALKISIKGTDDVAVCFFGDGAADEGTFHESINFASANNLPIVYVCLNNLYAIATRQDEVTNTKDLADRAFGYHIPGVVVDGNDPEAVYQVAMEAIERARQGQGPTLIECKTYKWHGHYEGDPGTYRPAEEVAAWMEKDPIKLLKEKLLKEGVAAARLEELEKAAAKEMEEAIQFSIDSPFPKDEDAMLGNYTDIIEEGR